MRFGVPRVNDAPDPYNPEHYGWLINVSDLQPRTFDRDGFPLAPSRTGISGDGVARHKTANGEEFIGDLGEIIAADVCVVDGNKILFGVRDDGNEQQLCLVGGKVDDGESVYEAGPREFREETTAQIDPSRLKIMTVRVVTADERGADGAAFVSMACRYDLEPGEADTLGLAPTKEIKGYHWLPFDPETGVITNDTGIAFFAGHDQLAQETLTVDPVRLAKTRAAEFQKMVQHRQGVPVSRPPSTGPTNIPGRPTPRSPGSPPSNRPGK